MLKNSREKIQTCGAAAGKKKFFHALFSCFFILLFSFLISHSLFSATPNKIKYQGFLKQKGLPVTGTETMKFRITNVDGTVPYWDSGDQQVNVSLGVFEYTLEVSTSIDWQTAGYYLEVTINGTLLSPSEEIDSTAYALQAKNIDDGAVTPIKTNIISINPTNGKLPALTAEYLDNLDGSQLTNINGTLDTAVRASTGAIQTQLNNVAASTGTFVMKAGDTMSGPLNMGGNGISNISTATATFVNAFDSTVSTIGTVGLTYFNGIFYGNGSHLTGQSSTDPDVRVSTGIIQRQLNMVAASTGPINGLQVSTGTIQSQLNNVALSTGVIQNQVNNIAASTGAIQSQLNNVAASTGTFVMKAGDTMSGPLNMGSNGISNISAATSTVIVGTFINAFDIVGSTIGTAGKTVFYGDGTHLLGTSTVDTAVRASTGTIQAQLNAVAASTGPISGLQISTGTIQSQLNNVAASTGAIQTQLNNVAASTGTIQTQLNNVAASTGTIQSQVNNVAASTGAIQTQLNNVASSTATISALQVSTGT